MSYGPMPPAPVPPPADQQPRGPVPSRVVLAVRLMFVVAALGVLGVIFVFSFKSQIRDQVLDKHPEFSSSQVDTAVNAGITIGLVIGVVVLVLYVLLALQVRKGKNWARIVTWVFAGLGVVSALGSFAQTVPTLSRVGSILAGVLDVLIIILLARENDFFRKRYY